MGFSYTMMILMAVLICFLGMAYLTISSLRHQVHMMQQNGYRNDRYSQWYAPRRGRELRKAELLLLIPSLLMLFDATIRAGYFIAAPVVLLLLLIIYWPRPQNDKKPLVFTKRAVRLYLAASVLLVLSIALLAFLAVALCYPAILTAGILLIAFCMPFYVMAANALIAPVEKHINNGFLQEAKDKLQAMAQLTTIGITGSYGKTSSKMIMAAVLSEKYETLATPGSFNTPMGVTRVVRESLSPVHEIFICEMGAKEKGDIAELCDLVHPVIGVLTAIGEQHLESFGSVQNIIDTKFELLESLPEDGLAVVNGDEPRITDNLHRCPCRVIRYGFAPDNSYRAENVTYGPQGTEFDFCHDDIREHFITPLLGRHMVVNILAALAVGDQLGVDMAKMRRAVRHLPSIEHRLQLHKAGSYYIIDDAFNSNPSGAAAALEVLGSFKSGKRIIITPGMVELGEKEYELNYELGRQLTRYCDRIILVGKKHSLPLQQGVAAENYPGEQLYVAADLNDARAQLARIVAEGDVVLFENDLPDTYNE